MKIYKCPFCDKDMTEQIKFAIDGNYFYFKYSVICYQCKNQVFIKPSIQLKLDKGCEYKPTKKEGEE